MKGRHSGKELPAELTTVAAAATSFLEKVYEGRQLPAEQSRQLRAAFICGVFDCLVKLNVISNEVIGEEDAMLYLEDRHAECERFIAADIAKTFRDQGMEPPAWLSGKGDVH